MDYIAANKEAWEEAFDQRETAWGEDIVRRINEEDYPFFQKDMADCLKKYNVKNKVIAQFCCNNGRELLSLAKNGAKEGFGFDIAENQIKFATERSRSLGLNCKFIATNILSIGREYHNKFDLLIITIGALCWFKELDEFFAVVSNCLKEGGALIINEQHPVANMLGAPGEENFDEKAPRDLVNSYFEKEWIENDGAYYITKKIYKSKTFTSFSHPLSEIIDSICKNGMNIYGMEEFDYDISDLFPHLNHQGIPLSYILEAKKKGRREL
ncbi:MAG TPA: SAM-dependent methyltransferase [Spirochaetaceae bacterium]|nr:SAM-dependent methyltransferase [Spirochaetaceae bacterium]